MRRALLALVATVLVAAGVVLVVGGPVGGVDRPVYDGVATLLLLLALVGALWKVAGDGGADAAPPPWGDDSFTDGVPERTPDVGALSGEEFASVIARAGETAREDGTVAAGLEVVRPHLRETLLEAMAAGGVDADRAERAVESGRWTGDPVAAAVLEPSVDPPRRSLRQRLEAWLFPERTVRRETTRATAAVVRAADEVLPVLPGRNAPRSVPVVEPSIADLRRGADDELRRAADPLAADRGGEPAPPDSNAPDADATPGSDADARSGDDAQSGTDGERDAAPPVGDDGERDAEGDESTGFAPSAGSPFAGIDGGAGEDRRANGEDGGATARQDRDGGATDRRDEDRDDPSTTAGGDA